MNTRQVGPFKVNPIGLGCMNICPVYGPPPPEADAQKLLLAALDEGVDFFEGRDVNHNLVFGNLNYEQYRWADANINYYLDQTTGQFVARVNQAYSYPTGV